MVVIEKLSSSHIAGVQSIQLAPEQVRFAPIPDEFLTDECDTTHLHVIYFEDTVVGYFKLDLAYAKKYEYCPPDALGLRAFVIGKQYQGKGLGTAAVQTLMAYLGVHYTSYKWLYLGVNCQNVGAYTCYVKAGLAVCEELYLGGPAGPQYIMYGKLPPG
ncbi:GNAT family N-acetyltransferase [Pseudoalteromonas sp. OOF1S-7]|uniref:GNAT family N-acetyltransferase n=1 Tax=Pseudoalteromonas sp. OOF1S-7 TaxID=2917757 RepID=UPI001EF53F02|nr:GNAT family N-acetyltransferase [Pseudoalteromonas sp. OOF1S-7]MCG7537036.1 GNAT family N-acetyltransferase [Pseudoalteromonas sp. OOF1S-7]